MQSEGRFSTLWGPGRRQEHGRRQARSRNSVPALSAAAVVQARQFVQHVLPKRACVFFGRPARSEIIPPAPPCFCLPASPVRQDRMNGKIMPEAKGEGGSAVGRPFFDALGPRATSGARPTAGAQPEFSSGVKRSRRRASKAVRTACLAQTGLCVLREAEVWKDWDCEGGAWRTLFGLRTQCRCVLTDSPAVADSCPACAGQS